MKPPSLSQAIEPTVNADGRHRHFVFLQGMPSPFFARVADILRQQGCRITRINLCPGDRLFWRSAGAIDYRGSYSRWPAFIDAFFAREAVTHIVLLGEQRRYHREAVHQAKSRGIAVIVTDFGYLRPDWITLERDGMSGNSHFPREPGAIRQLAARVAEPDCSVRFADSAFRMARADLLYNMVNLLFGWLYPGYRRSDLRPPTPIYTLASAWRLYGNARLRSRMEHIVRGILASGVRYFVFPLQLDFDFQIVAYSPYATMGDAIGEVLDSFARDAPPETRLVLKEHPWDPALSNWERFTQGRAKDLGIKDRVCFLRGGDLDALIQASAGVVTVNSTTGIRALQRGRPVKPLGQAIYDVPGLCSTQDLRSFWNQPSPPDPLLTRDFIKLLAAMVHIRGVFFQEPGLSHAVREAARRLLDDSNAPTPPRSWS